MNQRVRRALLSVSDKTGIVEFAKGLEGLGVEILSTGGTAKVLRDAGVKVLDVSDYTGFPEMMDGRLKTLHPKVHGGLLGRAEDADVMDEHGIKSIDLLTVNLYPFEQVVTGRDCTFDKAVENIDIGGPAMLRAAAKNYDRVIVLTDPNDYSEILSTLEGHGDVQAITRIQLMRKVFAHTAHYDGVISDHLEDRAWPSAEPFGASRHLVLDHPKVPRYGENPHQQAMVYGELPGKVLHGKELSYNNILDLGAAIGLIDNFDPDDDRFVVAILKHLTPCGVGRSYDMVDAYGLAMETDTESPFGGIVVTNQAVNEAFARAVHSQFTELIIAPSFSNGALEILKKKKDRRLIEWNQAATAEVTEEMRTVYGATLVQQIDRKLDDLTKAVVVTERAPTPEELHALDFNWRVVKAAKSNAVVFGNSHQTLAIGTGDPARVRAARGARTEAQHFKVDLTGSVAASDAFFPAPDGLELIASLGATAVVQPGGSKGDEAVIAAANEHNIAMIFTGTRHFKH